MALVGSLKDIGIIDLIQFPHQGRRSGQLTIVAPGKCEARLQYELGNLVHADCLGKEGLEALVPIVDLEEATFSFDHSVTAQKKSITVDLHHALLQTLKIRDELKAAQAAAEAAPPVPQRDLAGELKNELVAAMERTSWVSALQVTQLDGTVVADHFRTGIGSVADRDALTQHLSTFFTEFGKPVSKVLLERPEGLAMVAGIGEGLVVWVFASKESVMGVVVSWVSKLVSTLGPIVKP